MAVNVVRLFFLLQKVLLCYSSFVYKVIKELGCESKFYNAVERDRARESLQSSEVSHEPWPFLRFLLQLQISIFYLSPDIGPSCCQSHRKQSLSRQQHGCTVTGLSSGRRDCLQYIIASIAFSHSKCAEVLASFGIQSMVFAGAMETFMKRGKYPL